MRHIDQSHNGRKYRLFLVPMGISSPCGPKLVIFEVTTPETAKSLLHDRLALPHETETDLWEQAPTELEAFIRSR